MSHATTTRTWFVTGATSGIGRALTALALQRGEQVAAVARHSAALTDLHAEHGERLLPVEADVREEQSVRRAVEATLAAFGRIDVVANNAGYGLFGAVEEATDVQVRAVFDTNVFGVLNVLRATLPVLRRQGSGHLLEGSSLYGQSAHPGVGLLAATKYAVEGLTDALVAEVAPLGIAVTLVQPGPTASAFLTNLDTTGTLADYDGTVRAVQKALAERPPDAFSAPERIAEGMLAAADADRPPLRLALGASGARDMRAALEARLAELDEWRAVTDAVDA
ncbi:SDR family NAD(P)-dependent oxidoreductase [Actinomycetospora succinea]|nr:SDR family NAD(P)-dependent oxidoreductase [Actinomycetospora succinea]